VVTVTARIIPRRARKFFAGQTAHHTTSLSSDPEQLGTDQHRWMLAVNWLPAFGKMHQFVLIQIGSVDRARCAVEADKVLLQLCLYWRMFENAANRQWPVSPARFSSAAVPCALSLNQTSSSML
jgi:hypothetical protein